MYLSVKVVDDVNVASYHFLRLVCAPRNDSRVPHCPAAPLLPYTPAFRASMRNLSQGAAAVRRASLQAANTGRVAPALGTSYDLCQGL